MVIGMNHGFFGTGERVLAFLGDLVDDGWRRGTPTRFKTNKKAASPAPKN
jgi:hypothetical protein